jgi:dTDP-4-dehydrorhamnose reductase
MHALITGARGTVGAALADHLRATGHTTVAWDRGTVPTDDYAAMEAFVRATGADTLFHLAIASQPSGRDNESWAINYEWTSELAWICRTLGLRFVFTSTAMVWSDAAKGPDGGPFTVETPPDAEHGYGHEKRRAEERVWHQDPHATVVRLGWQIAERGENSMLRQLDRAFAEHGEVRASTRWLPACSFVEDTVAALARLAAPEASGNLYLLDSNERWTFFALVTALAARFQRPWKIVPTEDFVYDQRLLDARPAMPSLRERLPTLP